MSDIDSFREKLQAIITKFEKDKPHYLSKGYPEAQVRIDFINPFFKALGWDIENKAQKPPHERDVIVELSPEITRRPDYNFRINGVTKFFVEAKAPSIALDNVMHILQAKSYAWSTKEVYFVVLTDFEEFKLFDASLKPNAKFPDEGLIFNFKYSEYLDNIEKLWKLSKERVLQGSLESLLPRDTKSKRLRIPPDKSFLEELSNWRNELAKDIHKRNVEFDANLLNDVVQKLLDRIIFIRIAEDRRIRPDRELWDIVAQWKEEAKRKPIMSHLVDLFHEVNDDLNGDIFKSHACEKTELDSALLADIIENLYFPKSRYRFDAIGVELLGSIYERYLGSTIRVTPQRVKVEEKPEVRKAGGVYYTPKYIVDYIVKNTVGKVIEGKTPRQIEKIKILDPACGSGSFLLGAYQYLIDYHLRYYRDHPKEAQTQFFDFYYKVGPEDLVLPLRTKAAILRNNIFGVDIDPQAVEITMMSLYLKALEGERSLLPKKQHLLPPLSNNIKCGNSLIGYDIFDTPDPDLSHQGRGKAEASVSSGTKLATHNNHISPDREPLNTPLPLEGGGLGRGWDNETKSRINPFEWNSKSTGFGDIMENGGFDVVIGNPPYVRQEMLGEFKGYFKKHYEVYQGTADLYAYFIERAISLLKKDGLFSYIVANKWMRANYGEPLRRWIKTQRIEEIIDFGDLPVFEGATAYPCIIRIKKEARTIPPLAKGGKGGFSFPVTKVTTLHFENLNDYVKENSFPIVRASLDDSGWSLVNEKAQALLDRLRLAGVPLGEYVKGTIYRGVLTGLDNAFVIDEVTKENLIAEDSKSAELIKPYLMGRDIKRYQPPSSARYLLFTRRGVDIKQYPAIQKYLLCFREQLIPKPNDYKGEAWKGRKPGAYKWYEIQDAVDYYKEFEKPKIIYLKFQVKPAFVFDNAGFYPNSAVWIIPKNDLYLLGILNSKLGWLLISNYCTRIQNGYQLIFTYLGKIPIRTIDFNNPSEKAIHDKLVDLVDSMLELHKKKCALPPSAEREKIEREITITDEKIDEIVYKLYGITEEERKIIEINL
jgi:type I restriction-modification system DNA methylase subunit